MLLNYFKIAWRNLVRHKIISLINIIGMAIALAVCFMIGLYVTNELSYDRFVPKANHIVRVIQKFENGYIATTPPGLASALEQGIPGVDVLTEIGHTGRRLLHIDEKNIYVNNIVTTDKYFLDVFPFHVLRGSGSDALKQPGKLILTQGTADRLFGNKNPIGKTITVENQTKYEVAGVIEDPPPNFHFSFSMLLSLTNEDERKERYGDQTHWNFYNDYIYVRMTPGLTPKAFQQQLTYFEEHQEKPQWVADQGDRLSVQPLTDIHLAKNISSDIAVQGDRTYLILFTLVGLFILGIACFNFMNLSTARALTRSREVGIRKVSGATRKELIGQFLGESVVSTLLSFPIALLLLEVIYPEASRLLGVKLRYSLTGYLPLLFVAFGVTTIVGLIAGSYPAFVLSSLKPASMLKNGSDGRHHGKIIRKLLVITQFAITTVLIICTLVIYQQMHYVQQKRLGFNKENVITFRSGYLKDSYPAFKRELLKNSRIVSVSSGPPPGIGYSNMLKPIEDPQTGDKKWLSVLNTDYGFIRTIGLTLLSGRNFSQDRTRDTASAIIVNESAVQLLKLGDNPLGQTVKLNEGNKEVIGVVKDFHNELLYKPISPVLLQLDPGNNFYGLVRLAPGDLNQGIHVIETVWKHFLPTRPLEFHFLDDQIEAMYRKDRQLAKLFTGFSCIAIFIACMGLFGLAVFVLLRRTKEIGIRKVLGATVAGTIGLLSKDFLKLVLLGFLIAVPIAWYAMHRWLQNFAYHMDIGIGLFAVAGFLVIIIALATVSYQSVKAALTNPVESLRNE